MNALLDVDFPRYVTIDNAMRATGRSRHTIYRWIRDRTVRSTVFEGRVMVEENDVAEATVACDAAKSRNLMKRWDQRG